MTQYETNPIHDQREPTTPQLPGEFDCWSKWREYYLSLRGVEFWKQMNRHGYCGHEVVIERLFRNRVPCFSGHIPTDNERGAETFFMKTAVEILDLIEEL